MMKQSLVSLVFLFGFLWYETGEAITLDKITIANGVRIRARPETLPHIKRDDDCSKSAKLGCPGEQLQPNSPDYVPTVNGCGPQAQCILVDLFNKVIDQPWAHDCCDQHDTCYGTCDSDFDQCNDNLLSCLINSCNENASNSIENNLCDALAQLYHAGVNNPIACGIFLEDVQDYCHCPDG